VLNWSKAKYLMTLGVGSLGVLGMLKELWGDVLPLWSALTIAQLPVFVFIQPGELWAGGVRIAHVAASVWYIAVSVGLLIVIATIQPLPQVWLVYSVCVIVGAVPCGIVLYRAMLGSYQPPGTPDADSYTPDRR
jgi:hypothetical protein